MLKATADRFGEGHFIFGNAKMAYARFLTEIRAWDRLEQECRGILAIYDATPGPQRERYQSCRILLAEVCEAQCRESKGKP